MLLAYLHRTVTFLRCASIVLFALSFSGSVVYSQETSAEGRSGIQGETAAEVAELEWRMSAARLALESGLSATAVELYEGLLSGTAGAVTGVAVDYRLDYIAALTAQGDFARAREVLASIELDQGGARRDLYDVVVAYGASNRFEVGLLEAGLRDIEPENLGSLDVPWLFLLRGVVAESKGESELAREQFGLAENSSVSQLQRAFFASLVLRQEMLAVSADEGLLVEVRQKFDSLSGQSAAFPFLREYVIILHRMDRDGEAIAALENEMANVGAGYSAEERSELLLLKGLILGQNSEAGWSALKELVRIGGGGEPTSIALQLLARAGGRDAELMVFLNELISRPEVHPLLPMLYYIRCQLALVNPETAAIAEADARLLLEQFPGLDEITNVYRLLAYAALQRDPPQYRVAADYLLSLREEGVDSEKMAELNRLIGDCYFMNGDYGNAVDFYEAARVATSIAGLQQTVFLRLVISEIRSGNVADALTYVDETDFSSEMGYADRWRAEWNIAQALQSQGQVGSALERVRALISSQGDGAVPAALDMRLRWLEAHLSLASGEEDVQERVEPLLGRLEALPNAALEPEVAILLRTELLLLQAQGYLQAGEIESGSRVVQDIRAGFVDTSAAERSYFVEASYHATFGDFRSAQQVLVDFVAQYQDSELAPHALFQASLHCERRGSELFPDAVLLLNQLVQEYPESSLVYRASLRQGDLLRLMNDFAGAQLIYENLVNSYPGHELQYLAELSRADCIAALSQGDGAQLLEAATVLERLVDMPGLPADFQVEAGHKWGKILRGRGHVDEAREVFSLITMRYMLDAEIALSLESVGKYWLSRTVFALGEMLEEAKEFEEAKRLYRKMVAFNLPGRNLALARVDRIQLSESR